MDALVDRVESLLHQRRMRKQELARAIGMTRQGLWRRLRRPELIRVADLDRIAGALGTTRDGLLDGIAPPGAEGPAAGDGGAGAEPLEDYLGQADRIVRTLGTLPAGETGRRWKHALLALIEDAAAETGTRLPREFWELRRRVHEGEL